MEKQLNNFYVKPSSDIFIKYLFGMDTTGSKKLLLSFINSVLEDAGYNPITRVEQKNPFNYKTFTADKETILDIEAEDEEGRKYNIEVQTSSTASFHHRSK